MEAKFLKQGEVMIVELQGRLDFETALPFRKTCLDHLTQQKVVIDLQQLNFVGSLGLKDFVETIDSLSQKSRAGVKLCGLSSEFRRLFEASATAQLEIFESKDKALAAFG